MTRSRPVRGADGFLRPGEAIYGVRRATDAPQLPYGQAEERHPGAVGDRRLLLARRADELLAGLRARMPSRRLATTADVVDAVDFLLRNRSVNATALKGTD
ncbi:hypothetical protein PV396_07180 [Streptomyces sp. ME02-8801-2C]|uniref:hypothetical protein n=1 Tax=Streptomyces sp. ME02-8801-2C TaxID=3028680 RepID=UPI0029A36F96|nr:hypothetical protein [Streptomyces sp. ME02-8801-2C]MDX3451733.1 hypothetical protein [Streptomyces sp. ME02-8801-2C]